MPNTYKYINKTGGTSTIEAENPDQATLSSMSNRLGDSGVQLVITPTSIAPQPKTELPTTLVPTETPKQTAIDYDTMFGLTDFQKQAEKTQETGISEIVKSMGILKNEATDLQAERQKRGLEDLYKQGQATKSRITALDAEMAQDDIILAQKMRNEERRDTILPFAQMGQAKLAGDAAIYRGLKTAEKNTLISQQLAQQGEIVLAEQFAKDAIDAKYAPYKQNVENYKTILELIKPSLTAAESKRLKAQEMKVASAENEIKKAEATDKSIQDTIIDAINGGAPNSLVEKAKLSKNPIEVSTLLGRYTTSAQERRYKNAQIEEVNSRISKNNADAIAAGKTKNFVTPPIVNLQTGKFDPAGNIASVIDSLGAKADDKLKLTGAVVKSIQTLAESNPDGNFKGVGFGKNLIPKKITPVTDLLLGQEGQDVRTYLSSLEGTVETWMTGAAVSNDQAERIKREMVPQKTDTDKQIRQKLNALTNYMLDYTAGNLLAQGITYKPEKVDYFEQNAMEKMSNEQLKNSLPPTNDSTLSNNKSFFDSL